MANSTTSAPLELWKDFLESILKDESAWLWYFRVIAVVSIFVVSLIGNLITCIVIYYDRRMHTATNYYLFNLALSDFIVTFGILLEQHIFYTHIYGSLACKAFYFFVVLLWNNSILIMTGLAIERYFAIWYPLLLQSKPVWQRVMKIFGLSLTVALLESVPEIWSVDLIRTQHSSICFTVPISTYARVLNGVLALVTFVIPLGIMMFVYSMIALKVNVAEKKNPGDSVFNHRDNRGKVNRLVVALTLSFMICWLPFFTLRVLIFAVDVRELVQFSQWWGTVIMVVSLNSWLSIVMNPILFSLMSTKFRKALKARWYSKIKKRNNSQKCIALTTITKV